MENNHKNKILIVDDIEINRIILQEMLSDTYEIMQAESGIDAISLMINMPEKPVLLLLDIMMPGMDGFETLSFMKSNPTLNKIPVIFITAADQEILGLQAGAVDYISKPFEPEIVQLRVANQVELYLYREKLESMVEQKANELVAIKENFLDTMANLIEYRSLESGTHVKRTKELTKILISQLIKMDRYKKELIDGNYGALIKAVSLHDIGKIGIPDNILLKPGRLTPEEFKIIESHSAIGGDIIKSLMRSAPDDVYLRHCYDICRHHHEKWNGLGYPDKISGADIPLSARIVAVVDIYDALISERCYKPAHTHDEAINILLGLSGTHLDPLIIETLIEVKEQFKKFNEIIETDK